VDHVHADPAAAGVGHLVGRREARMEDQIVDGRVVHRLQFLGRADALVDGLVPDRLDVQARTVVFDLDDDVVPFT
jgi:hypothetical protein